MKPLKNLVSVSACAIAALVILAGCGVEEIVAPDEETNEQTNDLENTIAGLELLQNGKLIVLVNEETTYGTVNAQMAQNQDVYEVEFYNANGESIGNASHNALAWRIDEEYATLEQHEKWAFCIYGKKPGNTTFKLLVENESSADYSSPSIPLSVR